MKDTPMLPAPFDALDPASKRLVAQLVTRHAYPHNALVHNEGELCERLEWIGQGSVRIEQVDADGTHRLWHIEGPGRWLTLPVALATEPRYKMTITTSGATTLYALGLDLVRDLIGTHPSFAWALLQTLADASLGRIEQVQQTIRRPLRDRLLEWLDGETKRQGRRTIVLPLSKTLLAEQLGVARTSLSRIFQQLQDDGILTFDRNTVTLLQETSRNNGGTSGSGI